MLKDSDCRAYVAEHYHGWIDWTLQIVVGDSQVGTISVETEASIFASKLNFNFDNVSSLTFFSKSFPINTISIFSSNVQIPIPPIFPCGCLVSFFMQLFLATYSNKSVNVCIMRFDVPFVYPSTNQQANISTFIILHTTFFYQSFPSIRNLQVLHQILRIPYIYQNIFKFLKKLKKTVLSRIMNRVYIFESCL